VALDRDSIQKQDFPVGDGGYDRAAVDAHLRAVADQVDELQRTSGARGQSLADTASERIRAIVEGAETSAAEIQRHAQEDAERIRADAGTDAAAVRRQAKEQANALLQSLRSATERLKSELDQLEGHGEPVREATDAPQPAAEAPPAVQEPPPEPATTVAAEAPSETDDTEGARLIALNMALNGTPREETDRYLAAHYKLNDRGQLLDEVYASVEG
jgi:DivIVA domain-containing protein